MKKTKDSSFLPNVRPHNYMRALEKHLGLTPEMEDNIETSHYSQWMFNKALSWSVETVLFASLLSSIKFFKNKHHYMMMKQLELDSFRNVYKVSQTLSKLEKRSIEALMGLYNMSYEKARESVEVLNDAQKSEIARLYEQGKE